MQELVSAARAFKKKNVPINLEVIRMLKDLDVNGRNEKKTVQDMHIAYAMIHAFDPENEFFKTDEGAKFKDSILFDQKERAKSPPDRRSHSSCKYRPADFFAEWQSVAGGSTHRRGRLACTRDTDVHLPAAWDRAIRPILAHYFKTGILCVSYGGQVGGQAIAAREPARPLDLYVDYRPSIGEAVLPPHWENTTLLTRARLLAPARAFARRHPHARFAALRLWSAPHFWPLMLGPDSRDHVSFFDAHGREWTWKFVPKDMPESEWSIHMQLKMRLARYRRVLTEERVRTRRDLVIVMGEDAQDCVRLATMVAFAIQTRPWRLEVDLWRSFVNVDMEFLDGLQDPWLE